MTAFSTSALIGTGDMGGTVARLAVTAGLDVVLNNSRGPNTLRASSTRSDEATLRDAARLTGALGYR
jgi:predicted dinucleotide-binding enzyme